MFLGGVSKESDTVSYSVINEIFTAGRMFEYTHKKADYRILLMLVISKKLEVLQCGNCICAFVAATHYFSKLKNFNLDECDLCKIDATKEISLQFLLSPII